MKSTQRSLTGRSIVYLGAGLLGAMAGTAIGSAQAQTPQSAEQIKAIQDQINQLQRTLNTIMAAQGIAPPAAAPVAVAQQQPKPSPTAAAPGSAPAAAPQPHGVVINVGDQPIQLYGKADVAGTWADNSQKRYVELTTNNSYLGLRTSSKVADDLKVLFQIEGELAITNTPTVRSTFGFRDSYLGLQSSEWGTIKIGKGDTPYKKALLAIDPLTNTLGDARALFANTGGDNRVEFSLRAPHAIWYEAPDLVTSFGTFKSSVMLSPGQNPDDGNQDWAFGETVCSGASPASGPGASGSGQAGIAGAVGSGTGECNDGSFGTLASANVTYENAGWLVSVSGEYHDKTNRTSDEAPPLPPLGSVGIRSEWGLQFLAGKDFGKIKTYVGADILRRDALSTFNERSKEDYYYNVSWRFLENDVLGLNFVYATKTPGDPAFIPHTDNAAEMAALGWRHFFGKQLSTYVVGAMTDNHESAHYDLGASALGQPVLARGANQAVAIPGKTIYGLSVGSTFTF